MCMWCACSVHAVGMRCTCSRAHEVAPFSSCAESLALSARGSRAHTWRRSSQRRRCRSWPRAARRNPRRRRSRWQTARRPHLDGLTAVISAVVARRQSASHRAANPRASSISSGSSAALFRDRRLRARPPLGPRGQPRASERANGWTSGRPHGRLAAGHGHLDRAAARRSRAWSCVRSVRVPRHHIGACGSSSACASAATSSQASHSPLLARRTPKR